MVADIRRHRLLFGCGCRESVVVDAGVRRVDDGWLACPSALLKRPEEPPARWRSVSESVRATAIVNALNDGPLDSLDCREG